MDLGYLYALGAFVCVGSYMVPVRFATAKGLAFFPFMGLGMALLDLFRFHSLRALWNYPHWFWASVLSGFLWACGQGLANLALEEVSLAKASVLFNANTLINIASGLVLFNEASGLRSYLFLLAGGLLLLAGAWWVAQLGASPSKEGNLRKGVIYGISAGFFWGIYFTPLKAVQVWEPQTALSSLDLFSGLALGGTLPALMLMMGWRREEWSFRNAGLGLVTAGLWTAGMIWFLLTIQSLGLSRAVPIVNSSGLVYTCWSLFVFKEFPLSLWPKVLGGTVIVVAGVILMAFSK